MNITQEILKTFNDDPDLLKKVRTGDKSWVYDYDIETKAPSFQWKKSQAGKKQIKFGQFGRFCSLFSSIEMLW